MPQLDPSSLPSQLFWLAITFYALYWLMANRVLPRIAEVLEERSERISNDLEQAETLKKNAEEVMDTYEQELAQARAKAREAVAEVQREVSAYAEKRQQDEAANWAARIDAAEQRIGAAKQAAQAELRTMVMDVSQDLTNKLAGFVPDRERMGRAVDAALREQG